MGFRSSRRTEDTDESGKSNRRFNQQTTQPKSSNSVPDIFSVERGEEYYEMTIPDTDILQRLQMNEEVHGNRVHDWIDEGMPIEIMGRVRGMEAFRERQAERPSEVPTNIERQNNRSVQRSEQAVTETGRAGETGVPEPVRDVISSTGRSLDASIQRVMEDRMGDSFGDVQVHTGSTATTACESINARAFTVGNHVAFNSGEYDPSSAEGQHVIAHELAHVRQQTGGAVSMLPQEGLELEVDPDPQLEREAEETAQQVMAGGELGIQRLANTDVHIQRSTDNEDPKIISPEDLQNHSSENANKDGEIELDDGALVEYLVDGFGPLGTLTQKFGEIFSDTASGAKKMDEEQWAEVIANSTLKLATGGITSELIDASENPVAQSATTEVGNQARKAARTEETANEKLENKLSEIGIPDGWMSQLTDEGPPAEWKQEIKQEAVKAAKNATESGNRPERVPDSNEI